MAFKQYTKCFNYPGGGRPYNEKDRLSFIVAQVLVALAAAGVFAGFGAIAGPIGAIIGAVFGSIAGFTNAIDNAADQWLNHRLVCLDSDPMCAVGVVSYDPTRSDLGAFDNDQYFDVVLMPHPTVKVSAATLDPDIQASNEFALVPANRYNDDGSVVAAYAPYVVMYPANDIFKDGFQGQALLSTRADILADLGYAKPSEHERFALHCEAEGDFWVRIKSLAPALAALVDVGLVAAAAGAVAGSTLGSSVGCAILSFFFGPVGCAIGGFLGGLLGGAAGAAAGGAATYYGVIQPVLQAIFNTDPGDVEDANVGDAALGPIHEGDQVAVLGKHVYDGYHLGWNEFHPLMAVAKIGSFTQVGSQYYLQWQPNNPGTPPNPPPGEALVLTTDDMRQGLSSAHFLTRCENLKNTWCRMLQDAFSPPTRTTQQKLEQRWTIHPAVDGCRPSEPPPLH